MKIITDSKSYKGIDTLLTYAENGENLPLIIFFHGFGNDKFEGSRLSLQLALEGYAVLSFDIDRHGSRYDGFMDKIDSDVAFGKILFSIIENTHKDVDLIINSLSEDKRINIKKIGLIGYSLGANICNYELANRQNIAVCVSLLGSPNFVDLLSYSMEKDSIDNFETNEEIELLEYVESLDPRKKIRHSDLDCAWLMMNGKKDDDIPAELSQDFFTEIRTSWQSKIEFILEDEYHFVSNSMVESTINWVKKYLV